MPQPLSTFRRVKTWHMTPGSVWRRPQLAWHVMHVIEQWSEIEAFTLQLGAKLMQGDMVTSMSVLQALESHNAQRAATIAAARASLNPEHFRIFDAALNSTSASRNTRHKFAHHLWGVSDELLSELLLQNPRHANLEHARIAKIGKAKAAGAKTNEPIEVDRSTIFVWTKDDFDLASKAALKARNIVVTLYSVVSALESGRPVDSTLNSLANDPLIRQRLHKENTQRSP